jgi:hypothetical protein
VIAEDSGELVYTVRLKTRSFQPHVFAPGRYAVKVGVPETGRFQELRGLVARAGNDAVVVVDV